MANRVINIGQAQKNDETPESEVYKDVSMMSKYDCTVIMPSINDYYTLLYGKWEDIEQEKGKKVEFFTEEDLDDLCQRKIVQKKKNGYVSAMSYYHRQHDNPYKIDKLVNTRMIYCDNKVVSTVKSNRIGQFVGAVQNSIKNIFTWIPGERIINPEFGSKLRKLLYEQITPITEESIIAEIKGSVSRWEPRVDIVEVIKVSTVDDTEDNTIRLDIKYKIKGLENVYTYTYKQNIQK